MRDGVFDQIGQILAVQLLHDIGAMPAHGMRADVQSIGDFFGSLAFRQEFEDASFPNRQDLGLVPLYRQTRKDIGKERGEIFPAVPDSLHRSEEHTSASSLSKNPSAPSRKACRRNSFFLCMVKTRIFTCG